MDTATLKSNAAQVREKKFWWHWQNLNDKKGGAQGSGLRRGRCWWHFDSGGNGHSKTVRFCWNLWTNFCGVQFNINDEDATFMLAFPPFALWLSFSTNWRLVAKLAPRRSLTHYPDTIIIQPWSKTHDWVKADPWWVRGVNFSINPFEWKFMRHEERRADGSWVLVPSWKLGENKPESQAEVLTLPYLYILKNSTLQRRTATVTVERRAWRPRCLRWTSLIEKVNTCIDVTFDDEVGERTGSWKGGTIGCGYELRPGETAEKCLRRMESERKF